VPAPSQPSMRRFGDYDATRQAVFDNALSSVQALPPAENSRYRLSLSDAAYHGPEAFGPADHKQAMIEGRSLARRIVGTYTLTDKASGHVLDRKRATVAAVPWLTPQGTFVVDGTAMPISHQQRLLPGVYARTRENGTAEAHVNLMPGNGVPHRINLDPETGVYKMTVGQAEIPAINMLRVLGATDDDLRAHWGKQLFDVNRRYEKPHYLERLYEKFGPAGKRPDGLDLADAIRKRVSAYNLDPWVSRRTLGGEHATYGKDAMLAATKKLLDIATGKAEPDDRDNPAYATVWGPEHLIAERLSRVGPVMSKVLWQATNAGNLKRLPTGLLTPAVRAVFTKSGLAQVPEGTSSLEFMDHGARITKIGEGGIGKSADSIPMSCYDDETEVYTARGWLRWCDVTTDDQFACRQDGRLVFAKAAELYAYDYTGLMYGVAGQEFSYLVTPNHRMWCRKYRGGSSLKRCGEAAWGYERADSVHRHPRQFDTGHDPVLGDESVTEYRLPMIDGRGRQYQVFDLGDWAELVGWYVSEGSISESRGKLQRITISQCAVKNPEKVAKIAALLDRMAIPYCHSGHNFIIHSDQLGRHLAAYGVGSFHVKLTEECQTWPVAARRRLLDAMIAGDGSVRAGGYWSYTSRSRALVDDLSRLVIGLGMSPRFGKVRMMPDREGRSLPIYNLTVQARRYVGVCSEQRYDNYYTKNYTGKVYCAEVPGGLVYVRRDGARPIWCGNSRYVNAGQIPFIDIVRASESETIGVDLRTAFGTRLGADKQIYAPLRDARTGKLVFKSPRDLADATVAFPNAHLSDDPQVPVIRDGKMTYAPKHEIDYIVPSMEQTFSPLTNLVPLKSAAKAHRSSMGARMITQSLALANPEAPLVRTEVPNQPGRSFEELFGRHVGAVFARKDAPGTVEAVTPEAVTVRYPDGGVDTHPLYNRLPSGRKTGLHQEALVKPGDAVAPGQMIAKSNYVDANGHAAYGANLRTAFMTGRGNVYEDSVLISESAAKKLTSDHLYRHSLEDDDATLRGRSAFAAAFPGKHTLDVLKTVDDDGVVKPGTVVNKGDPLILAVKRRQGLFGRLSRSGKSALADASETWDYDEPGVVTDVHRTKAGPVVLVQSQKPAKPGDKLAGRHGNKGVTNIVSDHEMPLDEQGRPLDMIISSLGTISRANPAAIFEAYLGKIAAARGKPYVVPDFQHGQDVGRFVTEEGKKHGVKFMETVTDPRTGRPIPNVGVGNMYVMKLSHMAEGKVKGRGLGGYDETGQPLRGQSGKAMRASMGDSNALLSHGATAVIRDAHVMKGQSNDNFWLQYMSGFPPPRPTTSKAFDRFLTELKAAGINPHRENGRFHLKAMTDDDINAVAGDRVVRNGETLDFSKNGEPYKGGLFDTETFGSPDAADRWAKIPLHEPTLNPVFEEPTRRLLGLTEQKFRDVIAGKEKLPSGETGMAGIVSALKAFDVPKELAKTRAAAASARKTARDEANRKLGYLKTLADTKRTPGDWVVSAVPVLPPAFRPVSAGKNGVVVNDQNLVYKDLLEAVGAVKSLQGVVADTGAERLNAYDAVKAAFGLGDPVSAKNRERGVRGVLDRLLGSTSKYSYLQQKLLGTPVDLSGRGQVLPSPDLDLDQIGIPESMAWDVYHPFVVRRLVRSGVPRAEAAKHVEERSPLARRSMVDEMEERPALATRYPALHRYNVMAFRPVLVKGDSIRTNPYINKGYNLDHDGDTMTISIPLGDDAVREAYAKLLPSKNLISPATMKPGIFNPNMETVQGLHALSTADEKNDPVTFKTKAEAIAAYRKGQIRMGTRVRILET